MRKDTLVCALAAFLGIPSAQGAAFMQQPGYQPAQPTGFVGPNYGPMDNFGPPVGNFNPVGNGFGPLGSGFGPIDNFGPVGSYGPPMDNFGPPMDNNFGPPVNNNPCGSYVNPWIRQEVANPVVYQPQSPCDVAFPAYPSNDQGYYQPGDSTFAAYPPPPESNFPWPDCCPDVDPCWDPCQDEIYPPVYPPRPTARPPMATTTRPPTCPLSALPGWVRLSSGKHVYLSEVANDTDWHVADAKAIEMTGFLLEIDSQQENDEVAKLLKLCYQTALRVWIGGNNLAYPNRWVWSLGRPIVYSNWPKEDSSNIVKGRCVDMDADTGEWEKTDCFQRENRAFAVQIPAGHPDPRPPVRPPTTTTTRAPTTTTRRPPAVTTTPSSPVVTGTAPGLVTPPPPV